MRLGLAKSMRLAALLALLLAAETAALAHGDLDETHPSSECALCVGLATLAAGNVAPPIHVAVVTATPDRTDYLFSHPVARRIARPLSRGPPVAS